MRAVLALTLLGLASGGGQQQAPAAEFARLLERAGALEPAELETEIEGLLRRGDALELVLSALVARRLPPPEGPEGPEGNGGPEDIGEPDAGPRLESTQEACLLALVRRLGRARFAPFLEDVARTPEPARVAAALRLGGEFAGRLEELTLWTAGAPDAEVLDAFADAVARWLEREPDAAHELALAWRDLGAERARAALEGLERARGPASLACLAALLERGAEPVDGILLTLAAIGPRTSPTEAGELARAVEPWLAEEDSPARAACAALAGLRVPASVPALIGALERPATVRAAHAALRALGGVALPPTPALWTRWFAEEERWWTERAPGLGARLAPGAPPLEPAAVVAVLGELARHPLRAEALVPAVARVLEQREPAARVLACQALARLGSPSALPVLSAHHADAAPEVRDAARAATRALTHEDAPAGAGGI